MKMAICDNCHFTRYCSNTSKVWWAVWQSVCCKFLDEFNSGKISKIRQISPSIPEISPKLMFCDIEGGTSVTSLGFRAQ